MCKAANAWKQEWWLSYIPTRLCIYLYICSFIHLPIYLLSHSSVQLHPALCDTMACQASLSITNSQSLLKLISIKSAKPSNHLILCHPLLFLPSIFTSIRVFSNESVLTSGGQSIGVSALASVFPMNIQHWLPLGLTGLILAVQGTLKSLLQYHSSNASMFGKTTIIL